MKSNQKELELGSVSFITKLAGFEHTEYIKPNATKVKINSDDVPMYMGMNIKNGRLTNEIFWFLSKKISMQLHRSALTKKCLVLPYVGSIGDVAVFDSSERHHLASNVAKIELADDAPFSPEYLYYFLKSPFGQRKLLFYIQGGVQKNITIDAIRKTIIPIQDNANRIVQILSALDSKIELNNTITAELEALAKTLYDYWFVQFDFPDANGKPYKTSGGKMVRNEELRREIPKGWEVGALNDLGEIVGGSTPSKAVDENFCGQGIPWITPKDLSLNSGKKFISKGELDVSDIGFRSASLKTLPKNSILLSSRAPIGYMVIARNDVTTNQGFKSFVPSKGYSTPFIFYTIKNNMKVIEANASGSTFKEISGGVLKSILVCLSNKNIIDLFSKKVESIFKQQDVLEQENQELASLRDWLLPMLMNGQVSVDDVEEELGMVAEEKEEYKKR
jgi:type I restriction enzyme S subunit